MQLQKASPRHLCQLESIRDLRRKTRFSTMELRKAPVQIPIELVGHPRYRIRRLLGAGGMGTVWLAEHLMMQREVALKVIRPELLTHPGAIARFQREVRTTAKLNHPNLAVAHDAEQIGETFFLVMEYVPGQPLTEFIKSGPLPVAEACRCICEAAKGLGHAHEAGLVHRDVKPGNILENDPGRDQSC